MKRALRWALALVMILALGLAGRDAAHRYMEDKAAREGEGGCRSLWTHL